MGCGSDGNAGKISVVRPVRANAEGLPVFPSIAGGIEEPVDAATGKRVIAKTPPNECKRAAELEYADGWMRDFEALPIPNGWGLGKAWGAFDDLTRGSFTLPLDFSLYPAFSGTTATRIVDGTWGLPADDFPGPACDFDGDGTPEPNGWSLHIRGGQYKDFGGGTGHAVGFDFLSSPCAGKDYCPPDNVLSDTDPNGVVAPGGPVVPPYLNFSEYEGIAFWARKGPEGQPTILVNFTDKYTSDDLAKGNQKFCKRIKQCQLFCRNGAPCVPSPVDPKIIDPITKQEYDLTRCIPPDEMNLVESAIGTGRETLYPRCGEQSACAFNDVLGDPDFEFQETGATCQHFSFSGDEGGDYCVVPGTEPPGRNDRCGDGWAAGVHLTNEWKFYTVPFSELRQGGYGKAGPKFDTNTVFSITLGWGAGWTDMFIDNVTFYRRKASTSN
jgi:hypothetical protein